MDNIQLGHAKFIPYQLTPYEKMKLDLQEGTEKTKLTQKEKEKAEEFIRQICHHR